MAGFLKQNLDANPVAYKTLLSRTFDWVLVLVMAAFNSIEGLTLVIPVGIVVTVIFNIIVDIAVNVLLLFLILRTNPFQQRKYLAVLVLWNFIESFFNIAAPAPGAMIILRTTLDVVVNIGVVIICYRNPEDVEFVSVLKKLDKTYEKDSTILNKSFEPGKLPVPNKRVLTREEIRAQTVPLEKRLLQTPERVEAGAPPDPDIGIKKPEEILKMLEPEPETIPEALTPPTAAPPPVDTSTFELPKGDDKEYPAHKTPLGTNTYAPKLTDSEYMYFIVANQLKGFVESMKQLTLSHQFLMQQYQTIIKHKPLVPEFERFFEDFDNYVMKKTSATFASWDNLVWVVGEYQKKIQ